MDKENSPKPRPRGKAKILAATGIVCAMGGYICGDKIEEMHQIEQSRQPYVIADSLLEKATRKQAEWLKIQEQLQVAITSYVITIDSLKRVTDQIENYRYALESKDQQFRQCEEASESLKKNCQDIASNYENEQQEVKIRDAQIDSLESLAKNFQKEITNLQDEYKFRSPVENEFQAIHNCINAQGHSTYSYDFERQVKCCIKTLKKLQKKYPKDKFESITLNCNDR